MSEDLKKELDKLIESEQNNNSNFWILGLLLLAMITPTKQEPPIININVGSDK